MLNLNLNIIGGGIQKNKSDFDSTMVINFDQTSSAILNLNVVGTASLGFLGDKTFEKNYVSTQSAEPLDTFRFDRSSQVKATLSGSGDWGILQELPISPSSSISLVTMSLEVPYFGLVERAFNSSSVIDVDFTGSISRQVYDVNSFVNVDNPTLQIDYIVAGGGAGGSEGFSNIVQGNGGIPGEVKFGTAQIKINSQTTISAVSGQNGVRAICGVAGATNGTSSSLTFVDANTEENVTLFASGGVGQTTDQCGQLPITWFNGWNFGHGGNKGLQCNQPPPCTVQTDNPFVVSGMTQRPGYGGNGANSSCSATNQCISAFDGGAGLSAIRFYNPNSLIAVSGSAVTQNIDNYTYVYFPSSTNITLSFPEQRYPAEPLDTDTLAFLTATGIESQTTANAINIFVTNLKLNGLWDKLDVIYPFVGGTAEAHKYNLKDPRDLDAAYRITFSGSYEHSIQNGLAPIPSPGNNYSGIGDTHYRRGGIDNNISFGFWTKSNFIETGAVDKWTFGAAGSGNPGPTLGNYALKINQFSDIATSELGKGEAIFRTPGDVPITGLVVGSRTASGINKVYVNGQLKDTAPDLNTLAWPNRNVHFGLPAPPLGNPPPNSQYSGLNCIYAHIGDGLTDNEVSLLYTFVNTLQTSLDR
jgi:hypothetical protein